MATEAGLDAISLHKQVQPTLSRSRRAYVRLRRSGRAAVQHLVTHTGVGIVCAVAYFDPYAVR